MLEDWSSQKRARADAILAKRSAHATLLSDSTVPVAEYDVQHGKLRPLAKAEAVDAEARDDLVYKARTLLNASTAGATSSWLTPGTFGQEVAQRAREQIENNELSDDDVSVGAVAEDQDLDEVALSTGADALDRKAKSAAKKAHKLHLARTLVDVYTPAEEHTQVMLSTLRGMGALQPSAPTHPPVELFPEIVARKRLTVEDSELAHTVLQPMLPMQARREQYAASLALTKSGQPGTRVRQAGEGGAYLPSHAPSETTSLALAVRSDSGGSMRGGEHDERSAIVPFKPYLGERDEDDFEDALGTGVQALMQATDAMPEYVKQSKISERRLRTRHWQHAVALAAEHDLAVSETASMRSRGVVSDASSVASVGGEEGMLATTRRRLRSESESVAVDTSSSPLAARRRRIAQAVLGDVPGLEYNMEYSHIVDGQVYTRRPALLTKTLTATRYRLDNRPNVGSQDVSSSMSMAQLQSLVVGTDDPTQRVEAKKVSMFSPTTAAARRAERG
ncbi:hypothetical protein EON66_02680 [archaeon]|nr:MAG: hypothetical protein EON66_02680 [archaeon]